MTEPFNPNPDCGPGGLYFSDRDNFFKWLQIYGFISNILIANVMVPDDAKFVSIDTDFKKYKPRF